MMKLLGAAVFTLHSSFFISCSDWDDHYEADTSLLGAQQSTLWENISASQNLSQFASLLKKAGYDEVLNATQTYTVWAPADGSYDYNVLASWPENRLVQEFIGNHIARNNYPISGEVNQRLYTLNEKMMQMKGSGSYFIQQVPISDPNLASHNGVIHMLSGKIPFMANIYESLNANEYPLDSIAGFYHSYDVKKLNKEKSVQGPTLNGEITYLDSVYDEHNDLFNRFFAYINREDSNYTMLAPTNEAWNKARETVSKYFNYVPSFEFMENTSTGSDKKLTTVKISDVGYLRDSVINQMILSDLFYNNNIYDNKKLDDLQSGQAINADSLYSTTGTKVYADDARRLFENAVRADKSNGALWVTDSLRMRTWTSWAPEVIVQGENQMMQASYVNVPTSGLERVYVAPGTQNPEVPGHLSLNSYCEVQPASSSVNPGVVYYLPNVRSTTYSMYIVMVPANITNANRETKPCKFNVTLGYVDDKGKNKEDTDWRLSTYFTTDSASVDTVYLGDITFPVAYEGTGDYYPYIRVNSAVTSRERAKFDRTLRIDCIIMRPKELDDYLKAHPDYKYDDGDL